MPYSIPSDDEVRDALESVLRRMKAVGSLTKLRKLVIRELKIKDPEYTVSMGRLRNIAVNEPYVDVNIEARENEGTETLKGKCPVCDSKLKTTKNETLFGGTVNLGYQCTNCPYWTTLKRRVPTRYRFEYEKQD
ncbi:MAG: hypothetical protein R6U61_01475 [Thermoplasmata archaeon]